MYQHLAKALGIRAIKVWLNGTGARFCPRRTIGCTDAAGGASVHGCHRGYTANVTLTPKVLREVLRDFAATAGEAASEAERDCGVARDEERPKLWFRLEEEMERLF